MDGLIPEAYALYAERIFASLAQPGAVTTESDVATVVWRAEAYLDVTAASDRTPTLDQFQLQTTRPDSSDFQRMPTR